MYQLPPCLHHSNGADSYYKASPKGRGNDNAVLLSALHHCGACVLGSSAELLPVSFTRYTGVLWSSVRML